MIFRIIYICFYGRWWRIVGRRVSYRGRSSNNRCSNPIITRWRFPIPIFQGFLQDTVKRFLLIVRLISYHICLLLLLLWWCVTTTTSVIIFQNTIKRLVIWRIMWRRGWWFLCMTTSAIFRVCVVVLDNRVVWTGFTYFSVFCSLFLSIVDVVGTRNDELTAVRRIGNRASPVRLYGNWK